MNERRAPQILVVEDESALVTLLRYNLEKEGYRVAVANNGEEALARIAEDRPDLVLLDWMLPALSGLEVCRQVRRRPKNRDLPILMLTARAQEADKLRGLDGGADDYITKPFSLPELMARIRALLRRARPLADKGKLGSDGIEMDLSSHRVFREGQAVELGPTEFRLLRFLLEHPGRVFSREELLDAVWGPDIHVEPRTIDVHIRRLRKALNAESQADPIRTVRAAGYSFAGTAEELVPSD